MGMLLQLPLLVLVLALLALLVLVLVSSGSLSLSYPPAAAPAAGWWHGTVNLGETIGVSGQFLPNLGKWSREALRAVGERRWAEAAENFRLMLTMPGDQCAAQQQALCSNPLRLCGGVC